MYRMDKGKNIEETKEYNLKTSKVIFFRTHAKQNKCRFIKRKTHKDLSQYIN